MKTENVLEVVQFSMRQGSGLRAPLVKILGAFLLLCSVAVSSQGPKPPMPKPESKSENVSAPSVTPHELTQQDVAAFLDGIMLQQLAREDLAGAVISIVKDGKVIF